MTAREFVYATLTGSEIVTSLIGGVDNPRVFAKKSMTSSVEDTPYIVYKMGNSTAEGLSEHDDPERQYFQVWVHDYADQRVADYTKIDTLVRAIKAAFKIDPNQPGLWMVNFLETSQDLNDDTLNTVFRYLRFQIIKKEM